MMFTIRDENADACGPNETDKLGLRVGSIFVVLVTSLVGTLFPVVTKRVKRLRTRVPGAIFEFGKFFGSGVILATALIHLLQPASESLGSSNTVSEGGCISDSWNEYPYAFGLCLVSLFLTFVGELFAFRLGTEYLHKRGISMRSVGGLMADDPCITCPEAPECCEPGVESPIVDKRASESEISESESHWKDSSEANPAGAQILGVAILEFGIIFHSLIIGMTLTLSPPDEFTTLFIVIVFHQMFEGLGLGTRLAFLQLPKSWEWAPLVGAITYAVVTPLGMAIGLGTRQSVSMTSGTASVVSGILDSLSAGILLYAATVELIGHEFIFSTYYHTCSWKRVTLVLTHFATGAALMALLAKWA